MDRIFYYFESFLKKQVSRRTFFKSGLTSLLYFVGNNLFLKKAFAKTGASNGRPKSGIKGAHDLVLAEGADAYTNTVRAVEAMGGMQRFVRKDAVVVIKPNIAWDRTPAQAGNTDPQVIAALVGECYKAGAKRVNVFDIPCNEDRRCYENSGIRQAAQEKGAHVYFADHWNVVKAHFPYESQMEGWPILRDAIECDTFINVPVLKHHGLTGLTLSMKNLMGVCSGTRGLIHMNIGEKLVDLTDFINPDLTVIDATRVLVRHGPSGGSLDDVVRMDKIIVATDPTLADAFACTLVERKPADIPYIKAASARGFGNADITKAGIHKIRT
jgi:uncharacterized protein (DUF362 family)